jgi:hypothetical protein
MPFTDLINACTQESCKQTDICNTLIKNGAVYTTIMSMNVNKDKSILILPSIIYCAKVFRYKF